MDASTSPQGNTGNRLLDLLPNEERRRISASMRSVSLDPGAEVYASESRISQVQFPTEGVVSLMRPVENRTWIETAVVGKEGMVGIRAFLGGGTSGNQRAIGQVPGSALQMSADTFRGHLQDGGKLADVMFAYTQALLAQIAQSVVCNGAHDIQERCARWMLQVHDRVDGDDFHLTQEFLADMLAVRRASVTVAAGILQQAGLIQYHRGHVTITNRPGLEESSCECYEIVKNEYTSSMDGA
jgi:CRP-like cAMP-binding protein